MTIYIINALLIGTYSLFYNEYIKRKEDCRREKSMFMTAVALQMILIMGLRHETIGIDTARYVEHFHNLRDMSFTAIFSYGKEYGYCIFNWIVGRFTDSDNVFLTVAAILSIAPVVITVSKYSKMPFLSMILFIGLDFYGFMFSGLRQAIAYALTIYSYRYIRENKAVSFIICVLIAAQFHTSAYIFLIAYFIAKIPLSKYTVVGMIITWFVVFIFREPMMRFISEVWYDKYDTYSTGAFNWVFMITAVMVICMMFYKNVQARAPESQKLYMVSAFGTIMMLFATVGSNSARMANYGCMYLIFLIPEVVQSLEDRQLKALISSVVSIAAIALVVWSLMQPGYDIVPYRFFNT